MSKLVEVSYAVLDHVAFFLVDNGVPKDFYTGGQPPFWKRPYPHQTFVFPVLLQPGQNTDLYIKVSSSSSVQIPITIWSPEAFHREKQNASLIFGMVFGVLIAMFFTTSLFSVPCGTASPLLCTLHAGYQSVFLIYLWLRIPLSLAGCSLLE